MKIRPTLPRAMGLAAMAWLSAWPLSAQTVSEARIAELVAQARAEFQAQGPATATQTVDLRLEDAVKHAIERNLELNVERMNPKSFDLALDQIRAGYSPSLTSTFGQQGQTRTPTSQLNGGQRVTNDTTTYNASLSQNLNFFGSNASVRFNNNRTSTSDTFSNFNPQFNTTLTLNYTQPLLKNFRIDATRQAWQTTLISRELADLSLRALITNTEANVRSAYWDFVYAVQAVDVARESLSLAEKLVEDNKVKVEIGTMAPMDVVQAESEAATRRQTLVQTEANRLTTELALKRYIVSGTDDPFWSVTFNPVDRPDYQPVTVDIEKAIRTALSDRADLIQARRTMDSTSINLKYLKNQQLPQLDLTASYGVQGLGGTRYTRSGLGGEIVGTLAGGYPDALSNLWRRDYPTWNLQVNLTYPIGKSAADAQYASAQLKFNQTEAQLKALELTVATDVTGAGLTVQNTQKRFEAATVARQLAEQKLSAEQSKFEVGMQTNYFVVQAQRDLRDAQNTELRALLDYRKALVDFERAQHVAKR